MISLQQLKKDLKNPFNLTNIIIGLYCSILKLKESIPEEVSIISSDDSILVEEVNNVFDLKIAGDFSSFEQTINKGVPDGYAPLDSNNKVPLIHISDSLLGNVKWKGLYDGVVISSSPDASLNGLPLPAPSIDNVGWYFIANSNFTYGGKDYVLGDWIISNGTIWDIVDNTDTVSTVFGRTGHIIAVNGDYDTSLVPETTDKNYQTDNQKLYNDATSSIQTQLNNKVSASSTININGVEQDLSANREWLVAQANTGVFIFGGLSTASPTTINVGSIKGIVVDNETNPLIPTYTKIDYPGGNIAVPTLGSGTETFVFIGAGNVFHFQNTYPTMAQRNARIWLGKIAHPSGTITVTVNEPDVSKSPMSLIRSLYQKLVYINEGVYPYQNGANLNINTSGGIIGGNGINLVIDPANPDDLVVNPTVVSSFGYRTRIGGAGTTTLIDPTRIDVAGVPTLIGGGVNNSSLQYIYLIPGQGLIIQYGQTIYPTLNAAVAAVGNESIVVFPNLIKNSILIGVLAVNRLATQLNDVNQAKFFKADIFGQIIGATSGTSTGTLQIVYNNSLTPQITTSTTLGAVTVRRGSAFDTDNILIGQNGAGTNTSSITGSGIISGLSHNSSGSISASGLIARGNYFNNTLVATANNDALVGLDINPTFTVGAFTGTTPYGVRITSRNSILLGSLNNGGSILLNRGSDGTIGGVIGYITPTEASEFQIMNTRGNGIISLGVSSVTGFKLVGNNNLILQNGGTFTDQGYRLDVQGTTRLNGDTFINGKVGIGTAAPYSNLSIKGNLTNGVASVANLFQLEDASGGNTTNAGFYIAQAQDAGVNGAYAIGVKDSANHLFDLEFDVNGAQRMRILRNGNVGIATSIPSEKLDVTGNGKFTGTVQGADATAFYHFVTKAQLDAATGGGGVSVTTGSYTPTVTNVGNATGLSAVACHYTKIGDIVTVYVRILAGTTTINTNTNISVSLPIARASAAGIQIGSGTKQSNTAFQSVLAFSNSTTTTLLNWYSTDISGSVISASFQYSVLD